MKRQPFIYEIYWYEIGIVGWVKEGDFKKAPLLIGGAFK